MDPWLSWQLRTSFLVSPICRWYCPSLMVLRHCMSFPKVMLLMEGRYFSKVFGKDDTPVPERLSSCREFRPKITSAVSDFKLGLLDKSRTWRAWSSFKLWGANSLKPCRPLRDKWIKSFSPVKSPFSTLTRGFPSRFKYRRGMPWRFGTDVNLFPERFKFRMLGMLFS